MSFYNTSVRMQNTNCNKNHSLYLKLKELQRKIRSEYRTTVRKMIIAEFALQQQICNFNKLTTRLRNAKQETHLENASKHTAFDLQTNTELLNTRI
jgi:hypothetical protein